MPAGGHSPAHRPVTRAGIRHSLRLFGHPNPPAFTSSSRPGGTRHGGVVIISAGSDSHRGVEGLHEPDVGPRSDRPNVTTVADNPAARECDGAGADWMQPTAASTTATAYSPGHTMDPLNVPPTAYSRDDAAVVRGATDTCVSSSAQTLSVQPAGVTTVTGAGDGTWPSSAGAASAEGTSCSGSADAHGAAAPDNTMQAARAATR
jgi:hypothetical protein